MSFGHQVCRSVQMGVRLPSATGGMGNVRLWDKTGEHKGTLTGQSQVLSISFSPLERDGAGRQNG